MVFFTPFRQNLLFQIYIFKVPYTFFKREKSEPKLPMGRQLRWVKNSLFLDRIYSSKHTFSRSDHLGERKVSASEGSQIQNILSF